MVFDAGYYYMLSLRLTRFQSGELPLLALLAPPTVRVTEACALPLGSSMFN